MHALYAHVLESLFPTRCASCDGPACAGALFCDACAVSLVPGTEAYCPRCGRVYLDPPPGGGRHLCGACHRAPPPWRQARAAYAYGGALSDAVARWKNRPAQALGPKLSRLMVAQSDLTGWARLSPDTLVVPVPSHWRALRRRGFNPAGGLARGLARALGLTLAPTALRVRRPLESSRGLSRAARRRRARGAFEARGRRVEGRAILLVDDVMTTGATAEAATSTLLASGATSVDVAVLARAVLEP
ncbi:MAG: phosphoribosyltransferase [Proteobacteria bacterium]|nr:MAG: phosphoribosyltransferase [Pseudomonadota bacterium]